VTFAAETAVTRADLFDDAVYLSWYHAPLSTTQRFPEAFRFKADSFMYKIQRSEMFRRFEVAEQDRNKFRFDASQNDDDLIAFLEKSMNRTITRPDLERWRQRYGEFSAPFIERLGRL
jgi:hypothetical protein